MITNRTYGMDADVISYNARIVAGGNQSLSMQSLRQLNQFVISIKKIGLWYNMVCWPLRANQNAGTGLTAYSLGGLGTYNGTLVNGPTWQANGVNFIRANNTHITTPLNVQNLRQFTALVVANQTTHLDYDVLIAAWGTTTIENYFLMRKISATNFNTFVRSAGSARNVGTSGLSSLGAFFMYGWGTQGANTVATINGTAGNSVAFVPDETGSSTLVFGVLHPPSNAPFDGSMASVIFFKDNELSTAQQLSVYTLYKTTLGQDLALP
jgi:hypothetical protein